jgi:putative glycosyltransferase (TIGR04372 family)
MSFRMPALVLDQLRKGIDRKSRFLTLAFTCFAFTLSCSPRLVLFVLLLLPRRLATNRIRLAIGNSLFQLDYPAQALYYLERSAHSDEVSTGEYLLRAMCLFQGLGRFREAVSLLACVNAINAKRARRIVPDVARFRVLDSVWARHIGHTATLDYVVKLGILEGRKRDETILYVPPGGRIANRFLLDQMATHLRLIETPDDLPFDCSAIQAVHFDYLGPLLPDGTTAYFWETAAKTYRRWHMEHREPLLRFPPEIEERARKALERSGVERGAWFVALHVREGKWDQRRPGTHGILNADIFTYLPAIAAITKRGGYVVRMGDRAMIPLPPLPNVFDYCHSDLCSDWMDIFIAARCRFLLGTSSGPAYVPALYGVPSVLTNWWPPAQRPWHASDIFVPKLARQLAGGRYLTLSETLSEPYSYCHSRKFLAERCDVTIEDNDPEMISAAVQEMMERLDGKQSADMEATGLSSRADQIYECHNAFGMALPAREFLRRHDNLIA